MALSHHSVGDCEPQGQPRFVVGGDHTQLCPLKKKKKVNDTWKCKMDILAIDLEKGTIILRCQRRLEPDQRVDEAN